MGWISLLFIAAFSRFMPIHGHSCSHIVPRPEEVVHGVHIESAHSVRKRSINQQLRIHIHYDHTVNRLPEEKRQRIKNDLIPTAVQYWEETLQVRQTRGTIRLLRQCRTDQVRYQDGDPYPYCVDGCEAQVYCGETRVPEAHLETCRQASAGLGYQVLGSSGSGVEDTDFLLYVSAYATERCDVGTTVAYAAYCQLESVLDRPIAGYVNLCPHAVSIKAHDIHQMHSTIKHEILHALGFSAGLYAFYRDSEGNPLTPRSKATGRPMFNDSLQLYQWSDKVVKTFVRPDWQIRKGYINKTINIMVTPKVKEEVQKHFNCSTLEGAELEDQGVHGTALTHWEKRVFENEVMTGTYTQNPSVSRITLALLEDTGWYNVNYDNAEPLSWGRNLGCDFVKRSCLDWMEQRRRQNEHIHPFCERVKGTGLQTECTEERAAVALCNLIHYGGALPDEYQHFHQIPGIESSVENYAGSVVLADYCPYIQEFNWKKNDVVVRGSKCNLQQNNADPEINYMLEQYGNQSRCFDHPRQWSIKHCRVTHSVEHWGSGCYQYYCSNTTGLTIVVEGKEYRCYHDNQEVAIQAITQEWLHIGSIQCPPCQEICEADGVVCPEDMDPPRKFKQISLEPPCGAACSIHQLSGLSAVLLILFNIANALCAVHIRNTLCLSHSLL